MKEGGRGRERGYNEAEAKSISRKARLPSSCAMLTRGARGASDDGWNSPRSGVLVRTLAPSVTANPWLEFASPTP